MITYGNAGTYVAAQGHVDLPRPTKRRRGHVAVQPRCPKCRLPLVGRGDHLCLDLSQPEVVVPKAVKAPKPKPKKAPKPRVRKEPKKCPGCDKTISSQSTRCAPCANLARRAISPELDKQIAAMYQELRSAKRVADHFGFSQFAVADSLDRSGIERPGMGGGSGWRTLSESVVREIVAEYQAGSPVASIGTKHGVSVKTVYKALRHGNAVKQPASGLERAS